MNKSNFLKGFLIGVSSTVIIGTLIFLTINILPKILVKTIPDDNGKAWFDEELLEDKLHVIEELIDEFYLNDVNKDELNEGIYKGLVAALGDPYSTYYTKKELLDIEEKSGGIYYGIGAYVGTDPTTGLAVISGVFDNSPASEAGLRSGDLILEVDGVNVQGMDISEVVTYIKGEEGTTTVLSIVREGERDTLKIEVQRRKIETPTVKHEMLDNNIGYITLQEFSGLSYDQFKEAMDDLEGRGMKSLIVDLRDNHGGNLSSVVDISRLLLPKGIIVYTEDKEGNRDEYSNTKDSGFGLPLVVLVNGMSASASEILAGAIQDYGVGTIMGTTTFGKGVVQRIISLTDGSAVKLTISKYFTPLGNDIHGVGVTPDEVVEFDADAYVKDKTDNQLEVAKEWLSR